MLVAQYSACTNASHARGTRSSSHTQGEALVAAIVPAGTYRRNTCRGTTSCIGLRCRRHTTDRNTANHSVMLCYSPPPETVSAITLPSTPSPPADIVCSKISHQRKCNRRSELQLLQTSSNDKHSRACKRGLSLSQHKARQAHACALAELR